MNRRGQLADYATYIVMLFVISIVFLVVWFTIGTMNQAWDDNAQISQTIVDQNNAAFGSFGTVFDNAFLMMFVGVLIAGLILSYVLQSNPGMFFVLLIVVFLMSMVAGYMGNAYTTVADTSALAGAGAGLPIAAFIMDHYLLMTFIVITLMTIVFFAKPNSGVAY